MSPLVGTRGKAPKALTILRYFKLEKANSWLIYTENKEITTSKDNIRSCKINFIVLKIDLHIQTKIAK